MKFLLMEWMYIDFLFSICLNWDYVLCGSSPVLLAKLFTLQRELEMIGERGLESQKFE